MFPNHDNANKLTRRYLSEILSEYQINHSRGVVFGLCPLEYESELAGWHHSDLSKTMDLSMGREVAARIRSRLESMNVNCAIEHAPGIENPRYGLVLGWTVNVKDRLN